MGIYWAMTGVVLGAIVLGMKLWSGEPSISHPAEAQSASELHHQAISSENRELQTSKEPTISQKIATADTTLSESLPTNSSKNTTTSEVTPLLKRILPEGLHVVTHHGQRWELLGVTDMPMGDAMQEALVARSQERVVRFYQEGLVFVVKENVNPADIVKKHPQLTLDFATAEVVYTHAKAEHIAELMKLLQLDTDVRTVELRRLDKHPNIR
ncbi:MAG: hypothetical protein KDI39_01130 [Pseudomonadales bacterium]|nr:hypothetical protein [Pseudomonadales bacterium]